MNISLNFSQYLSTKWVKLGAVIFSGEDAEAQADDFEFKVMSELSSRGRTLLLTAESFRVCVDVSSGPVKSEKITL